MAFVKYIRIQYKLSGAETCGTVTPSGAPVASDLKEHRDPDHSRITLYALAGDSIHLEEL